ncbi:thioredoxin domain-containing protein [Microbacterium sp. X-17]|uniref:DsbA family protein n=1 Tax=Microbacterium sp. X-17 TaxID=3144404 RepID=UPI0031F4ABED
MRVLRAAALSLSAIVVVGAIAGGVYWAVSSSTSRPQLDPVGASGDGFPVTVVSGVQGQQSQNGDSVSGSNPTAEQPQAVPTPTATAAPQVSIDIYIDYLSPQAKEFQLANVQQLSTWVEQKSVNLTYFPVAMLTAKSNGTKYSVRAASAAACVATYAPDKFFSFNNELLRTQPDQDAAGPSDDQLATLATSAGVASTDVKPCILGENYLNWVKDATDRALAGIPGTKGVTLTSTPMILVNGTPYLGALGDPKEFQQFVLTVSSDAYYNTASPTPTPTASVTPAH